MAFKSVLISIEPDSEMHAIESLAEQLADNTSARFHVLGVAPEFPKPVFKSSRASKTARQLSTNVITGLNAKVDALTVKLPANTSRAVVSGRLVEETTKAVLINQADLVLKAASTPAEQSTPMFGSIDKRLIRHCPAPVWVVREEIGDKFDRIAVAIDRPDVYADQDNRRDLALSLIDHAIQLASFFQIDTVDVVYAWDAVGADLVRSSRSGISAQEAKEYMQECEHDSCNWLDEFIKIANQRFGCASGDLTAQPVFGRPRIALVDKVHELESDVLLMGTIARSGALGLLIGNTAEAVLDRLQCSVLALKPAAENIMEDA